jgi:hypothetical protein
MAQVDYITAFNQGGSDRAKAWRKRQANRTTTGTSGVRLTYKPGPDTGATTYSAASAKPTINLDSPKVSGPGTPGTEGSMLATPPGGFVPAGANNGNVLDENYTGWAQGLRPDAAQMLFQEPQALIRQVMSSMGMSANQNPGMYYMALPQADLANALAMLQLGGNRNFDAGNINSVINTMGDFFQQGLTRGGKGVDFGSGLKNALNAGTGTALGDFLNLDDPRGQVQAMSSLLMPLAEGGLHPLFAQAFQSEINRLADEYYSRVAFGEPGGDFQDMLGRRLSFK